MAREKASLAFLGAAALLLAACGGARAGSPVDRRIHVQTATPTATATATPSPTATPTPSPMPTATPEPTATRGAAGGGSSGAAAAGGASGSPLASPSSRPAGIDLVSFQIPSQGVSSGLEYIGLLPSGHLDAPRDPYNTGWYYLYDFPGQPGNAVFSAHVDYFPNIRGPFYGLADLGAGSEIVLNLSDGRSLRYAVFRNVRYHVDNIPMGAIIWPSDRPPDEEWITMITCGGEFRATTASGAGEYLHRDVVVARRVE